MAEILSISGLAVVSLLIVLAQSWQYRRELAKASSLHEFQMMTLVQTVVLTMRSNSPAEAVAAIQDLQTIEEEPPEVEVEERLPEIVGFKTSDGAQIDLMGEIGEDILSRLPEEYLIRKQDV